SLAQEERGLRISLHLLEQCARFLQAQVGEVVTQRDELERQPDLIHFLHLRDGQRGDKGAAIADRLDQGLRLEPPQCFADRALADIEASRDMVLKERLPRGQITTEDLPSQRLCHELGGGQPFGGGFHGGPNIDKRHLTAWSIHHYLPSML